ncbi:MAG: PAS domain-containing sensor histidine kinase [Nibricoccus sp.]
MPVPDRSSQPFASTDSNSPLRRPYFQRIDETTTAPWGVSSRVGGAPGGPATCALFVIDRTDTILAHQFSSDEPWFHNPASLDGKSLRTVLAGRHPEWGHRLPSSLFDSDETFYLPDIAPGLPGLVLAVHRLRCGGQMHVTLVPELAPRDLLKHAGISDFTPDPATFAKIFLRLRTVENRLDHYLAHLPGVVFHQHADLSFAFIGPGCEALMGLESQSLSKDSQALLRLIHPADEGGYYQELDRQASSLKPFSLVYRVLNPQTGTYLYLLDVRSPVRSADGLLLGYEGVWLDITRQKIAEHHLTTHAWKESIATLTSGLLDQFSDAMTGIYSLSELYHKTLASKHPLHNGLGLIKDNAAQAQRLLRKIIDLNREATGEKGYANLGKLVRDQLELIKIILPRGTQLSGPLLEGDWPVLIDETAFRQTLVNLALNSRDALRGPGAIRLTLRRLEAGAQPLANTIPPIAPLTQPSIELVFADNGAGIDPAHLPRIFDPFFSTKESRRGSGLGLYHARLFAESHGGTIAARSTPDKGTEIVLVLPLADLSLAHGTRSPLATAKPNLRRTRVLYFEPGMTEESTVLDELHHPDWEVRTVATQEHARRILREDGSRLELVIIRQARADAELRILLAEIRRDHPGLPIALALTYQSANELPATLRSQVDLLLPAGLRDRDAADPFAKLLRTP